MGIHGNSTCVMAYDGAKGWLVGTENKGMAAMFVMMNEARLGTGLQGLSIGTAAYQAAVEFAHDRLQGRSLTGAKSPDQPADSIMVHPDVRRMLLEAKAFVEGGQAFTLWTALQADLQHSDDAAEAQKAHDYMGLITPVLKAYLTDKGFHVIEPPATVTMPSSLAALTIPPPAKSPTLIPPAGAAMRMSPPCSVLTWLFDSVTLLRARPLSNRLSSAP